MKAPFDLLIPIAAKHKHLVLRHIALIEQNLQPSQVIIVTSGEMIEELRLLLPQYTFIDENRLIAGLNVETIRQYLQGKKVDTSRAGWYFQQFIKMAYALHTERDYYLAWDIDTAPYKQLEFFSGDGKVFFSFSKEYYKPYFRTMNTLIGLDKSFSKSFITEHLMVKTEIMKALIDRIAAYNPTQHWFINILDAIKLEDLGFAGFSEYETYGTFVYNNYKEMYQPHYIWHYRHGDSPNSKWKTAMFARVFETVSYEGWRNRSALFHLFMCISTSISKLKSKTVKY